MTTSFSAYLDRLKRGKVPNGPPLPSDLPSGVWRRPDGVLVVRSPYSGELVPATPADLANRGVSSEELEAARRPPPPFRGSLANLAQPFQEAAELGHAAALYGIGAVAPESSAAKALYERTRAAEGDPLSRLLTGYRETDLPFGSKLAGQALFDPLNLAPGVGFGGSLATTTKAAARLGGTAVRAGARAGRETAERAAPVARRLAAGEAGAVGKRPRTRKLLDASQISDFEPGRDKVVRRGDRTYVVDTRNERAPTEVKSDIMLPEFGDNLARLSPEQRVRMREEVRATLFLSDEGRAERLGRFEALDRGEMVGMSLRMPPDITRSTTLQGLRGLMGGLPPKVGEIAAIPTERGWVGKYFAGPGQHYYTNDAFATVDEAFKAAREPFAVSARAQEAAGQARLPDITADEFLSALSPTMRENSSVQLVAQRLRSKEVPRATGQAIQPPAAVAPAPTPPAQAAAGRPVPQRPISRGGLQPGVEPVSGAIRAGAGDLGLRAQVPAELTPPAAAAPSPAAARPIPPSPAEPPVSVVPPSVAGGRPPGRPAPPTGGVPPGAAAGITPPTPLAGRGFQLEPYDAPGTRLLGPSTRAEEAIRRVPLLRQAYGAIDPAAIHQSEQVARLGIGDAIYRETQKARAKAVSLEWGHEARLTLGFDAHGIAKKAKPLPGVPRGKLSQTIFDLVEHPERYTFTPEQTATIQRAQGMMDSVLRSEQAAGVDISEVANYWYRNVIGGPRDEKVIDRLVQRARTGGTKGHTRSRFYEFAEETVAAGYKLDTNPLTSLVRRLEAGIDAVADKEVVSRIAQLPGVETPAQRIATGRLGTPGYYEQMVLGKIAPREMVEEIDKWISIPGQLGQRALGAGLPEEALRLWRSTMVSLDLSAGYIQGQSLFYRNNVAWWKAQAMSLRSVVDQPLSYVSHNYDVIDRGIKVGAISPPSEFLFTQRGLSSLPTRIPLLGRAFRGANRAFEYFIFVGQTELYKAAEGKTQAVEELVSMGSAIRKIMGSESYAIAGVSRRQREIESLVAFAPRFYRALGGTIAQAFTTGPGGNEARKALGAMLAGATALTFAVHYKTTGRIPNFTEVERSDWGRAKITGGDSVEGSYISFLGPFHTVFRTLARAGVYTAQWDPKKAAIELQRLASSKASLLVRAVKTGAEVGVKGESRTFEGQPVDLTPQGILNYLQEQAPISPAATAKGIAEGRPEEAIGILGPTITPVPNREIAARYEQENRLPKIGTPLQALLTAYRQAGEGLLSDEGRKAWAEYEPLPSAERKRYRDEHPGVAIELVRIDAYRTVRRKDLAKAFPDLDVALVEEAWKATPQRGYTPKTPAGWQRLAELRGEKPKPTAPRIAPPTTPAPRTPQPEPARPLGDFKNYQRILLEAKGR